MSTKTRGFASMDPARRQEVARRGGASAAPANRTFSRDPELAREAGRKGGLKSRPRPKPEALTNG
jgi:general stress protein YciG